MSLHSMHSAAPEGCTSGDHALLAAHLAGPPARLPVPVDTLYREGVSSGADRYIGPHGPRQDRCTRRDHHPGRSTRAIRRPYRSLSVLSSRTQFQLTRRCRTCVDEGRELPVVAYGRSALCRKVRAYELLAREPRRTRATARRSDRSRSRRTASSASAPGTTRRVRAMRLRATTRTRCEELSLAPFRLSPSPTAGCPRTR